MLLAEQALVVGICEVYDETGTSLQRLLKPSTRMKLKKLKRQHGQLSKLWIESLHWVTRKQRLQQS
jgi:hypothetical protein